jgi:hypothetical protein
MRSSLGIAAAATAAVMVCGGVAGASAGCGGSTVSSGSDGGNDGQGGSGSSGSGGGSSSSGSGGSSSGSSSGSGGSGSNSGSGGSGSSSGGPSGCPANPPTNGMMCMHEGVECEYGTNPNPACNEVVECQNGTWAGGGTGMMCPTGLCPATYADVPLDKTCTPVGLDCPYPEGQCNCSYTSPAGTGAMPTWHCFAPQGCPEPRPPLGGPCSQPGLSCDYGACTGGLSETCDGDYWVMQGVICPG